jgi:predicted DNA-binding transcriptional regulator AlpA
MPDAIVTHSHAADAAADVSAHVPTSLAPLPADDRLIPAAQMPAYIGLAVQTLARLRHEGKGPAFVRVGRRIFYPANQVRQWLNERTYENTIYNRRSQADKSNRK